MKTTEIAVTVDGSLPPIIVDLTGIATAQDLADHVRGGHPGLDVLSVFHDEEHPLDPSESLHVDKISVPLHVGRRTQLKVIVNYQSKSLILMTPSATRTQKIKHEAVKYFGIPAGDAPTLVLVLTGTTEPLNPLTRIGSLDANDCEITLDLIPDSRIQG